MRRDDYYIIGAVLGALLTPALFREYRACAASMVGRMAVFAPGIMS